MMLDIVYVVKTGRTETPTQTIMKVNNDVKVSEVPVAVERFCKGLPSKNRFLRVESIKIRV